MTLIARLRHGAVACALALTALASAPSHAQVAASKLEPAVASYLSPLLRTNNFAGVIVVAKGDRIVFQKGYGYADVEQGVLNQPDTVFQIASVSKPFTAAAIQLLVERGKLDLHAPLTRVLPDYPQGSKLTIHHLLTHGSGIPNINAFPAYADTQLRPQQAADLVEQFKNKPLEFEPGGRYAYSNSNYNLLALIIEKVSGLAYGEFLQREIFAPLQIKNSGHRPPMSKIVPGLADGYAPEGTLGLQRADYLDWSAKTGNGSLYSDAAGILRFVRAAHQGRLMSRESAARSFTPHFPNIGYGWFLTTANGREIHHTNGRSPGWSAQVDHYVKDDLTVIVLSNLYVSVTTPIARAVGAIYFAADPKPLPALSAKKLSAKELSAFVGTYQFGPDYYLPNAKVRVAEVGGDLVGSHVDSSYPAFAFIPIAGTEFLLRSFWSPAKFTLAPDGRVVELHIDDFRGRRIEPMPAL
jgi:CubicO group peptidase (beta-lactamase class C family)